MLPPIFTPIVTGGQCIQYPPCQLLGSNMKLSVGETRASLIRCLVVDGEEVMGRGDVPDELMEEGRASDPLGAGVEDGQ